MAHAWVEIYLDNIGWVNIETTPGGSLENQPTQDDIDRWEAIAQANKDKYKPPVESESEDTQETEDTQESQNSSTNTETEDSETQQPQDTTIPSESESNDTQNSEGNGIGSGSGSGSGINHQTWKVLGVIGVCVATLLVVLGVFRFGFDYYEEILREEVEAGRTRKATKRINRRMYQLLRLRNPKLWLLGKLSDVAYEKALIDNYTMISEDEWKQFMEIVKKNHYSREAITVEEMQYVYECYKKAMSLSSKGKGKE